MGTPAMCFLKDICLYFYYMYECVPACIYTYHIACRCSQRPKDDVISGAVHGCELPCGWELSLGPLEEQKVLLAPELSL